MELGLSMINNILYTVSKLRFNENFNVNFTFRNENYSDELVEEFSSSQLLQPLFFKNFALDIVTETAFNYPQLYVSEKIFKSISTKRMFIYVGPPNTLKFIKELGFKTFSDYINEDYDNELDYKKRFEMIKQEILQFTNRPLDEVKEIVLNLTPTLEHNYNNLLTLYDRELESVIFQLES